MFIFVNLPHYRQWTNLQIIHCSINNLSVLLFASLFSNIDSASPWWWWNLLLTLPGWKASLSPVDETAASSKTGGIPKRRETKAAAKQVSWAVAEEVEAKVLWWKPWNDALPRALKKKKRENYWEKHWSTHFSFIHSIETLEENLHHHLLKVYFCYMTLLQI